MSRAMGGVRRRSYPSSGKEEEPQKTGVRYIEVNLSRENGNTDRVLIKCDDA